MEFAAIVVAGGDGTVRKVVKALLKKGRKRLSVRIPSKYAAA